MLTRMIAALAAAAALATPALAGPEDFATDLMNREMPADLDTPCEFEQADRVVVIGSVVGNVNRLRVLLQALGLTDGRGGWTGEDTVLVQMGNLFGRDSVDEPVRLLMSLEEQAAEAGGAVHVLLGRTDVQTLRGDLSHLTRYTEPALYQERYADDEESVARRDAIAERLLAQQAKFNEGERWFDRLRTDYKNFLDEHLEPGAAELLALIAPETEMGDWLRSRNAAIRIGDVLYSHAGVSPDYAEMSLMDLNNMTREQVRDISLLFPVMLDMKDPVWWPDAAAKPYVAIEQDLEWTLYQHETPMMAIAMSQRDSADRRGRLIYSESRIYDEGGGPMMAVEVTPGDVRIFDVDGWRSIGRAAPLPEEEPPAPDLDDNEPLNGGAINR